MVLLIEGDELEFNVIEPVLNVPVADKVTAAFIVSAEGAVKSTLVFPLINTLYPVPAIKLVLLVLAMEAQPEPEVA